MNLHENNDLYRRAIQFTAQLMKLSPEYVEKDYWVTYALYTIFNSKAGDDAIFKGGTALSKCYGIIDRFSEDIDLVVLRHDDETDSKMKSKLKNISTSIESLLPEMDVLGITQKMGMNRKTAHSYKKVFNGNYGQVRDAIVLESSWLGSHEPFVTKPIQSMAGRMMIENGQKSLAEEFGLMPFDVNVLDPRRTLCEKIMSLVRFSYGENPIVDLQKKIRHTYDIHKLLRHELYLDFFESPSFEQMLLQVAKDDVLSYRNNNEWLMHHPGEALLFRELDDAWKKLEPVYNGDFKNLVYGDLPKSTDVLRTLKRIKARLGQIEWNIEIPYK